MDERAAKLLLVGGMMATFPIILGIMLAVVPTSRPSASRPSAAPGLVASRRPAPVAAAARASHARSTVETAAGSSSRVVAQEPTVADDTPSPATIDPAVKRELEDLRHNYDRQIDNLQQSRDAQIAVLAEGLRVTDTATGARILATLDDELAALTLRQLPDNARHALLSSLPANRRRGVQRHLRRMAGI